jgi:hypothetical protein
VAIKNYNWNRASIFGWIGCVVGGFSICFKVVCIYVLTTVGTNPATVPYVLHLLQADLLTLIIGMPSGICSWILERRKLGTIAIILCVAAIAFDFIHR